VDDLFTQAVALPAEERAAWLAAACGDDSAVRREVEGLLAHDEAVASNFLAPILPSGVHELPSEMAAAGVPAGKDGLADPLIGRHVGHFEVRAVIAVGGMGTVYEAVQDQPHRVVALKVMNQRASPAALKRFQYEAEILGRLRHTHVAQVYEAGVHTEGGWAVPYFALELVPGATPLNEYVVRERLSTRQRLELFVKVCDAVHHGHQQGVIHRDLKPGNILVDATGEPKVIDFGVARATDADLALTTQHTAVGALVGTIQYMSPEQCDGDAGGVDTRSDVYSLGVVLYELLTGVLPYDASTGTIYAATRVIREQVPRSPSTIDRKLKGDLETIVLKALAKDREQRYASATELSQDLRRYLAGEPIAARPPTALTQAVRWAIRRPVIATGVACTIFVVGAVGVALCLVWLLNERPARIRVADDKAEAQLLSFSDRVLRLWPTMPSAPLAQLVDRPAELGAKRVAVIGRRLRAAVDDSGGQLCLYNADDQSSEPIWTAEVQDEDLPADLLLRGFTGRQYEFAAGLVADIFADAPGEEIVAVFTQSHSQRLIRVYNLAGEVLYQVWHDGGVKKPYWMSGARLLVIAATHDRGNWEAGRLLSTQAGPRTIFAVRPQAGEVSREYVEDHIADHKLGVAWYIRVTLGEASQAKGAIGCLDDPPPPHDPRHTVEYTIDFPTVAGAGCSWVLNEHGAVVEGPSCSDPYEWNRNRYEEGDPERLPDVRQFRFLPWP
jgi:hypothetical protein